MQIENDTCYIRHYVRSDEEFAFLSHYQKVWDGGFSVDDYSINNEYIYYEAAAHHGVDPDKINTGTYIMKKQYLQWTSQIQQAKATAVRMMQQETTPINHPLGEGDFIFYTWINEEEDEDFQDNEYYGMRIVKIEDDCLFVQSVQIGKHYFDSSDEVQCYESANDILRTSYFITAEAFKATHDFIRNFCKHLLEEIKSHARATEFLST